MVLHIALAALLVYLLGSSESGLGNREGSLKNFRNVGIHVKLPQTDEFEQTPTEEELINNSEETTPSEVISEAPFAKILSEDPFEKPPVELSLPEQGTNFDEVSLPPDFGGAPSSGGASAISPQATGTLPSQTAAPLGIGESAFLGI